MLQTVWIAATFALIFTINFQLSRGIRRDAFAQQELDRVTLLPGQGFNVDFAHYAGFVTVNEEAGRALFYWFFEASQDPSSKPILLWQNGGPGCSSIAYGLAEEIGPFHIENDGKNLYLNPFSWNQVANLLFIDSPAGVGFSYSNTSSDIQNSGDGRTAGDSLEFLLRWFKRFPQYKGGEFYIAGESYAGHYTPELSHAIVRYNGVEKDSPINFKGFMVGNALTDDYHDHLGLFQFLWAAGLISDQTYMQLSISCANESWIHVSEHCDKLLDIASTEMGNIDQYSIFTPICTTPFSPVNCFRKRLSQVGLLRRSYDPCTEQHSDAYFNLPEVQRALHIPTSNAPSKWSTCSEEVYIYWKDCPSSMLNIYHELVRAGVRIWVFSGDTDAVIPVTSTRYSVDALNLTTTSSWHAWYDDGQVGGWTQEYEGLTLVTVRGAGHEVPLHRPKQALTLAKSFLSGTSMPTLKLLSGI